MTMPNSPAPAPVTPAAVMPSVGGGASARAAALKASLESASPEPAGESSATPSATTGEASSPADSGAAAAPPAATTDAQRAAAERMQRIENVRKREAAAEAEQRARQQSKAKDGEVETLRKRIAELEPHEKVFASEEALLAAAEAKGMTAEKLVAWMRTRLTDPGAVAKKEAQTEAEKLRAEMKELDEKRAKEIAELKAEKQRAEVERQQFETTSSFLTAASSKTDSHPRVARALGKWKQAGLIEFVNHTIAPHLAEGYTAEYLHDVLEDYFEKTDAFGGSAPTPEATPAPGASHSPKKNGAGQPATTLSNALTSGRESLVEDIPSHKLSREDRQRLLREKLERE